MMNTLARTARMNATSILRTRFPTTMISIARKSTLTQVSSDKVASPTSPHTSQAIKANRFVFLSAQLPCDSHGNLIKGGIKDQTQQIIENTKAVLEAAGSGLESVVKVDLSVKDFHMVEEIDEIFGGMFPQKPARSVQQVMFMEKGADVMMGCVAMIDKE
ncbi:hypothetical protein E4T44_00211 [Aureobasidium sp. EXF-8845]|nr:hypothetical protein E4T44_00211 [Aureobasidium sp. EXF-8845]KAI4858277.1 hypothetical protein E4T45_00205 [Aureobasidium sp. EXF-8846]